jgi:GntR family transcriptional regulator, rspAB operon transcriptional repressor
MAQVGAGRVAEAAGEAGTTSETLALDVLLDRRRPVAEQIYQALRRAIVSLRLPPGTAISENRICRHVGVSRTPVREAIIRLAEDDLIEVFPQQGSFVAPIKLGTIRESHFIRKALELAVLRQAASSWSPALSARAHALLAAQEDALARGEEERFHELDEAFHRNLADSADLAGVWNTIQGAKARVDRVHRLAAVEGRLPVVIQEHRAVIEALDEGRGEEAVVRLEYHLDRILALLDMLVGRNQRYFVE